MLLRRFTDFILQSRLRTLGIAFAFAFLPILGSISILIAGLVTLRRGAQEGFLVLVAATLPLLAELFMTAGPVEGAGGISNLDIILLMAANNVLTWAFAICLRRYASWSLVLQLAALLGVVAIVLVHLAYPDVRAWWQTNLTSYMLNAAQSANQLTGPELVAQKASFARMVDAVSPFATGFVVISVVFYAVVQLLLARWWQAYLDNPGGLRKELYDIRLSYAAGILLIIGIGLSFTGNAVAIDAMPVLYVTFALAGLSIVHTLISLSKQAWFWIGLMYIAIVLMPLTLLFVAFMALLDAFYDIRKQIKKRQNLIL